MAFKLTYIYTYDENRGDIHFIYVYNRAKIGGTEVVKKQAFLTRCGSGLFQGNLSSW